MASKTLHEMTADVVVVGSGAGGAAAAKELAEGGLSVVLVEEGHHYKTEDFDNDPRHALQRLYRHAGASVIMGKPPIIFTEGRCVGGSTVVNGGISWRTPEKIVKRWEWEHGLRSMTMAKLEPIFLRV